jgi:hypothetical protein
MQCAEEYLGQVDATYVGTKVRETSAVTRAFGFTLRRNDGYPKLPFNLRRNYGQAR